MIQRVLYISGRVQGVFYRAFCKQTALTLGVVGYAENLPDSRVKVVIQATDEVVLDEFERLCWRGPEGAEVTDIACVDEVFVQGLIDFTER